jgi:hypothetical protein
LIGLVARVPSLSVGVWRACPFSTRPLSALQARTRQRGNAPGGLCSLPPPLTATLLFFWIVVAFGVRSMGGFGSTTKNNPFVDTTKINTNPHRPGGPDFYINLRNNTNRHGPGGQTAYNDPAEADPCFAKVVQGFDTLQRMHGAPIKEGDYNALVSNVAIVSMKLIEYQQEEDPDQPRQEE